MVRGRGKWRFPLFPVRRRIHDYETGKIGWDS